MAVFCSNSELNRKAWGDLAWYEYASNNAYECSVAEVMCIKFRPKESTESQEGTETGSTEGEAGSTTEASGDVPTPPETEEEEPPLFIIESDPYSYAKECSLKTGCLCNVNASDWAAWE